MKSLQIINEYIIQAAKHWFILCVLVLMVLLTHNSRFWVALTILNQMGWVIFAMDFNSSSGVEMVDFRKYFKSQTKPAQFNL